MNQHPEHAMADIKAYLAQHERKELLRFLTCGSVDDGKSTLIGRLLHDSKLIYEDQLAAIEADSLRSGNLDGKLDLSLLVDGLQAEREQGITIDVAYRYFSTARRKFIIADTPGHEQYTRNMATGASNCDLAIILIDARHGVLTQTRRHSFIVSLLGIQHIIVAVNKMDLVDYSEEVFNRIRDEYLEFGAKLEGVEPRFIPLSAKHGDNVVHASPNMPWYEDQPLMTMLETVELSANRNFSDFRFPVQYVNRPNQNFRGYCGTVASGVVRKGDDVVVLPSGRKSRIKSIVTFDEELELAFANMAVTLTLEDEIDVGRGDLLAHPDNPPVGGERLDATVVWMAEQPLLPGVQYEFKLGARTVTGTVKSVRHVIDIANLAERPAARLELNEIGRLDIVLEETVHFDSYRENRATGGFILIDRLSNVTVGAGMVHCEQARSPRAVQSGGHVSSEERAARYGQRPATIMFIGISGSGKSTLAHALERRLFDLGRFSTVLDGKTMRLGISRDLPHDAEGRAENLRRSAHVARFLNDSGLICCAAFVAPNEDSREHAISVIGRQNCYLVWLNPPLDVCVQRDPSGLYAAARENESAHVPGLTFPYRAPAEPQLELDTSALSVEECVDRVMALMEEKRVI